MVRQLSLGFMCQVCRETGLHAAGRGGKTGPWTRHGLWPMLPVHSLVLISSLFFMEQRSRVPTLPQARVKHLAWALKVFRDVIICDADVTHLGRVQPPKARESALGHLVLLVRPAAGTPLPVAKIMDL